MSRLTQWMMACGLVLGGAAAAPGCVLDGPLPGDPAALQEQGFSDQPFVEGTSEVAFPEGSARTRSEDERLPAHNPAGGKADRASTPEPSLTTPEEAYGDRPQASCDGGIGATVDCDGGAPGAGAGHGSPQPLDPADSPPDDAADDE